VHLTAGGIWFLGELSHHQISEETYSALWYNLRTAIDYGQDDMIYDYWGTAHQYVTFSLGSIMPEYDTTNYSLTNDKEINARQKERERFIEFHHALGAELLYVGKTELLRKLFSYTTSSPPQYVLLPSWMDEIFLSFVQYNDAYSIEVPLDIRYSFPNEQGLGAEGLIKKWLCTYMAVLFLRQYTIQTYLITEKPLAYPSLPADQPGKKQWLDSLDYFKRLVSDVLQNTKLLQDLKLDFITEAWCSDNRIPHPLYFIEKLKQQLGDAYKQGADYLPLSAGKVAEFCNTSGQIIEQVADDIIRISNPVDGGDFENSYPIRGACRLEDKDAFSEKPEVDYSGFATGFALALKEGVKKRIAYLFAVNQTSTYNLQEEDVFLALDKIGVNSEYVLINQGINLSHLATQKGIEYFLPDSYKGAEILDYRTHTYPPTLLVVKKTDLPLIQFLPLNDEEIEKYSLVKTSQKHSVYATVLDLNEPSPEVEMELQNHDFGEFDDKKVKSQALVMIQFIIQLKWRKGTNLVQIISHDSYSDFKDADDVSSITPL